MMNTTTTEAAVIETADKCFARATLYVRGEFLGNIHRVEARNVRIRIVKYAQYAAAVEVTFVPKGARRERVITQAYGPSLVVLDGWGHFEPGAAFVQVGEADADGTTVSRSRHSSCSEGWAKDFAGELDAYLASTGIEVAADYRGHDSRPHSYF